MDFGLVMFATDETIGPASLARLAEDAGFESLFFPEHTHIPVSRQTSWPGGEELPRRYTRTLDLFVALTAAAAATQRLRVGSGVCLVVERDPIVAAKEVATLDLVSGGRVDFGVGAGWNREEMSNHGTDPRMRFALLRERVEAMKAIWTQAEASYHGRFVDFDPIWCWPKPVQQPHPPVLVGGLGPKVLDRVLAYGDGWIPNPKNEQDESGVLERIPELERRSAEAGRNRVPVTIFGARPSRGIVDRYAEAGVARCLFSLPSAPAQEVEPALERLAELVASFDTA